MRPEPKYICDLIEAEVKKVIKSIREQGNTPLFALVDKFRLLKVYSPSNIFNYHKRSKRPINIYYIYSKENSRK